MIIDLKKTSGKIGLIVGLLALFGISTTAILNKTKGILKSPEQIVEVKKENRKQDSLIEVNHEELHWLQHVQEVNFYVYRLLTVEHDSSIYHIGIGSGRNDEIFQVDTRITAYGVELAFVFDLFVIYPIRIDAADGRKYIMYHDINTHENKVLYLSKQPQR